MVVKKGKLIPATNNNNGKKHENNNNNNNNRRQSAPARPNGDVYAQVKMLKQSVQEVNALIEPKRSDLILQRTKELETVNTSTHFTRSVNTASVKRSSNFKSILNKFNVMSTNTTPSVVEQNQLQHHQNNQKRSLPNIKT